MVTTSAEDYCPFGGIETIYTFISSGGTYVSHTHLSNLVILAGVLLLTPADAILLLDGRYAHASREAVNSGSLGPVRVHSVSGTFEAALAEILVRERRAPDLRVPAGPGSASRPVRNLRG